ncbi:MAG: hypothetical protein ABSF46_30180 [Terriglobia bacterium]
MSELDFSGFSQRKVLGEILDIPPRVESVYSLTQHVWAGNSDSERRESKRQNRVRLDTLEEFFVDPVRSYLHRILEAVGEGKGQGFWLQAEFGVGKSHLLAATSILAVGLKPAWDKLKEREDAEKKAGPGGRLDTVWRSKVEKKRVFPVVFSLEGCGGGNDKKLEDFILDEAQATFGLREGKPLAVYPEEHLARLFLREHQKNLKDDLRTFLVDTRLMKGLSQYDYDELIEALKDPQGQRDAGRVLMAFYRHKNLSPHIPTERGERLRRAIKDILEAGYQGVFIAIDEMSEYLRRSHFTGDDEDCLLALSSTLAKAEGLPVWTLVAAQAAHTNPKKIVGPDRLREELLEHKAERFRDIVIQRTRRVTDAKAVEVYRKGYANFLPWVKSATKEEFEACFPFTPDAIGILRSISTRLTGTRSTISFLHRALKNGAEKKEKDLVALWKVLDDLMSYNETPSNSASGAVSIRSGFRNEVAALEAAQSTLKRIQDGQLARSQNKSRAERILNTLFLYHIAGVAGLNLDQILDSVCDIKPGEETVEAQRGHYETILDEMCSKLRNQIRRREGRFEFIPKETSQYDDLVYDAAERLKKDPELFRQMMDRLVTYIDPSDPKGGCPFGPFLPNEDWQRVSHTVKTWHGQERNGKVTIADLEKTQLSNVEVEGEDDFLVVLARRAMTEKDVDKLLRKGPKAADPRVVLWAPAEINDAEKTTVATVAAHLLVADEHRDTPFAKTAEREFRKDGARAFSVIVGLYTRGVAKTSRTSLDVSMVGGVDGALTRMASAAMETCYEAREIDFGNRKFDGTAAVKLINGLVKLDQSVSEGDQLWSAVENFAGPLGLVRPEAPKRLDPEGCKFFKRIRDKILEYGQTGLEVRTVYNWFTGYRAEDGVESMGLTRRMVDIYLLCLARKGAVRISQKHGSWIDRNNIAKIDFKPDTLRGLERVDLPRPLENWTVFYSYLEVLLSRREGSLGPVPEGSLGPAFDRAKADESLRSLWADYWLEAADIDRIDKDLSSFFRELGKKNTFDELLLFWLTYAEEPRPAVYDDQEVYLAVCRAVLKVAGVDEPDGLTAEHLKTFKKNVKGLAELRTSFGKTSGVLLRAAKLGSAPVPDDISCKEIRKAQQRVLAELETANELILNPDTVKTRLEPRLENLEGCYVPAYVDALAQLDTAQGELEGAASGVENSKDLAALKDFASELTEAEKCVERFNGEIGSLPKRLRPSPEDLDKAEAEVKQEGMVKGQDKSALSLATLLAAKSARQECLETVPSAGERALLGFATFLRSPGVVAALGKAAKPPSGLSAVVEAKGDKDLAKVLAGLEVKERQALAKELRAALGNKSQKPVRLSQFAPKTTTLFEQREINDVVSEFKEYLSSQWEDGSYLKLEP